MGGVIDELATMVAVAIVMLGAAIRWPFHLVLDLFGG